MCGSRGLLLLALLAGLFPAGCCAQRSPADASVLRKVQVSLHNLEQCACRAGRAQHGERRARGATRARTRGWAANLRERGSGCFPGRVQITKLALDRVHTEASMAAKGVFYGVKHPRLVTLRQTIGVIDTYITKLRAAGQRVNQCTLASSLIHSAYLVDVQLVQLASAYLSRHPRRRSLGKQLAIYQQAAQAAQTKCKGTSKATSSSPAGGTR